MSNADSKLFPKIKCNERRSSSEIGGVLLDVDDDEGRGVD